MTHPKDIFISALLVYVLANVGLMLGTGIAIVAKANFNEFLIIKGLFSWLFAGYGYYYCIKKWETGIIEKLFYVILVVVLIITITTLLFNKWNITNLLAIVVHTGIAFSSYGFYKSYYLPKIAKESIVLAIDNCTNCGVNLIIGEYDKNKLDELKRNNNWVIGRYDRFDKEKWDAVLVSSSAKKCPKCGELITLP